MELFGIVNGSLRIVLLNFTCFLTVIKNRIREQSFMGLVVHPVTHENDRCRGERQLARDRFSINISGRPAGRPYNIAIFETVPLIRDFRMEMLIHLTVLDLSGIIRRH
jgi:hypothetical protein